MQNIKTGKDTTTKNQTVETQKNEELINQMNYLQHTMGNQKVQELIKLGALPANMPDVKQSDLETTEKKRNNTEKIQIEKDREELRPEIEKIVTRKKNDLERLKKSNPGRPIYANVTVELTYANIPGEKPMRLYHYTELKDVDVSFNNINQDVARSNSNRSDSIELVYSFLYDENKIIIDQKNKETEKPAQDVKVEKPDNEKVNPEKV
jgi:hypothetical protein